MGCQDEIKHHNVKLWDSLPQDAMAATDIGGWGREEGRSMDRITDIS